MSAGAYSPTGVRQQPHTEAAMAARLAAADRPGEHLWIMTAAWLLPGDPRDARNPAVAKYLDADNLVTLAGPGCYKCERPYSAKMAKRRCLGSLKLMPS